MESDLIHLIGMAKAFSEPGAPTKVVLHPTTLAVPTNRRVVVLGKRSQGKSVFLRLLAGLEKPTRGRVVSNARLSPLIQFGSMFHGRLTGPENIRFYARSLNLDADQLTAAIAAYAGTGDTGSSVPGEQGGNRKAREIALLTLMGFNCYLIDEIGHLPEGLREQQLAVMAERKAGVVFTTNMPQLARRYADCAIVIRNGFVHPFSNVEEAVSFNE